MIGTSGEDDFTHRDWLATFGEVIEEVKQEMKNAGRDDEFVGAKVCSFNFSPHSRS